MPSTYRNGIGGNVLMEKPARYRARMKLLKSLIGTTNASMKVLSPESKEYKVLDNKLRILQNGRFPSTMSSADDLVFRNSELDMLEKTESNLPLSDTEKATYNTWFEIYPQKVAGEERDGTGWLKPVLTVGSTDPEMVRDKLGIPRRAQGSEAASIENKMKEMKMKEAIMRLKIKALSLKMKKKTA